MPWRDRAAALRNVRPLLGMMWATSPPLVLSTTALRVFRSLVPLTTLILTRLIMDAVVSRISHGIGNLPSHIWRLVGLQCAIVVSGGVFDRVLVFLEGLLGNRFTSILTVRLMRHATELDLASFEDPVFYDKLDRARLQTNDRMTMLVSLFDIWQDLLSLISLSAGLILFSPWLLVLLIAVVIPSFLTEAHFTAISYRVERRRTPERRWLDYLRFLGTSALTAKELRIFGLGNHITHRFQEASEKLMAENRVIEGKKAFVTSALSLVSNCGYYAAYSLILVNALAGGITAGTFLFLTGAFWRSRRCVEHLLSRFNETSRQALFLDDLFEFFEMKPAVRSPPNARAAPKPFREGFEFQNVGFAYPGSDRLVLQHINFCLHPAERVALVGDNGAGKTTLVKLLTRLYDPTEGRILLDGIDLREYDVEDLRRQTSVVFQDYVRYDLSVRDNIGFGAIESISDQSRIEVAAQKSLADKAIGRLPWGYDQLLGKRFTGSADLSGGEWQKIAVARAYMRDAQLILLDEPTASLDARSEKEMFQRFVDLSRNRLAVLTSHRFSTVRMADRILVLENGIILEQGTHDQLIAAGGRYAALFDLQAAGYR